MRSSPLLRFASRLFLAFDFLTPQTRWSFAMTMLKYAAVFAIGYAIQLSGILAPDIARGNEVLIALLVILFLPVIAALCRRLTDAGKPLILSVLPLLLWGGSSAAEVMFGWPLGRTIFEWAALASLVLLVIALCLPTTLHARQVSAMEVPS